MTEFWGYDGSYQGNAFELSIAFNFMENGQYEMFLSMQMIMDAEQKHSVITKDL